MEMFIHAARTREEALDHLLILGLSRLGKTTFTNIMANKISFSIIVTSGPVLKKTGNLTTLLRNLEPDNRLFIDEIHRLSVVIEKFYTLQ